MIFQPNMKGVTGVIHLGAHKREEAEFYGDLPVIWIEAEDGVVISDHDGECEFYRASNGASSSILKPKLHLKVYPRITFDEPIKVRCQTLDNYLKNFDEEELEKYNFLNMDIQGAELLALKGAYWTLRNIDMIYTEVNIKELYEGCALIEDLDNFLNEFERTDTMIYSQFFWGDGLYKRKK